MRTIYVTGIIALLSVAMVLAVMPVSAEPTAESFGVEDASGKSGTYVAVPVTITNVMNGPVQGIRLSVDYNENVLNLTSISNGDLTENWTSLLLGVDRHTVIIATAYSGDAIPNGRGGSVVLFNFHVIGSSGTTSPMKMTLIELSNPDGIVGTAPAKDGTFTVTSTTSTPTTSPLTYSVGGGGGYYVPPTTPTPKGAGVVEAEEVVAPPSPTFAPNSTPVPSIQTPTSAPATVPKIPPLFIILIIIGVIGIAGIIITVLRR
jgi:hypothetical protein